MMVELWTRKREMGDEDRNNVEDMSGYEKAGVRVASLGLVYLVLVEYHDGSGLIPTASGIVNWLAHKILLSSSFPWWFPLYPMIYLFLVLNSTIT